MANSKSFKIAQKTAFEAKGRPHIAGKVIQRLFNIDLYTYLAIYRYRWGKLQIQYIYYKITIGYTHTDCVGPCVIIGAEI